MLIYAKQNVQKLVYCRMIFSPTNKTKCRQKLKKNLDSGKYESAHKALIKQHFITAATINCKKSSKKVASRMISTLLPQISEYSVTHH